MQRLEAEAPRLAGLGAELQDLAFGAVAAATRRRYQGIFSAFTAFARAQGIPEPYLPASEAKIASFLNSIARAGRAASTLAVTAAALAWAHTVAGLPNPFASSPALRMIVEGAARASARPQERAPHLDLRDYRAAVSVAVQRQTRQGAQLALMVALAFGAFLRFSELRALQWRDVIIRPDRLILMVRRSKTMKDGAADPCPLPASQDEWCPLRLAQAYSALFGMTLPYDSACSLWPDLSQAAAAFDWSRGVTDAYCYEALRDLLLDVGLDGPAYSWHSLRSGAATAADEAGLGQHVIATMGAWSSQAVQRYMRVPEERRASAVERMMRPPPQPVPARGQTHAGASDAARAQPVPARRDPHAASRDAVDAREPPAKIQRVTATAPAPVSRAPPAMSQQPAVTGRYSLPPLQAAASRPAPAQFSSPFRASSASAGLHRF